MNSSMRGVPVSLLFVAGAACGILLASLIVLCTHPHRAAKSTTAMLPPAAVVAPDPMFDMPPAVEPASPRARPQAAATPAPPIVKKAVTRNNVRRHHRAPAKPVASGDLLTAAL